MRPSVPIWSRTRPAATALVDSGLYLHLKGIEWKDLRRHFAERHLSVGLQPPAGKPDWVIRGKIYEVQVGYSVFAEGFRYTPYPQLEDLLADRARMQQLGFDTVQVMPCQAYPSYNVHAYEDITTTYGVLRQVGFDPARAHPVRR